MPGKLRQYPRPEFHGKIQLTIAEAAVLRGHGGRGRLAGYANLEGIKNATGISHSRLFYLLRDPDRIQYISLATLVRLCGYLECQPGDLMKYIPLAPEVPDLSVMRSFNNLSSDVETLISGVDRAVQESTPDLSSLIGPESSGYPIELSKGFIKETEGGNGENGFIKERQGRAGEGKKGQSGGLSPSEPSESSPIQPKFGPRDRY